jgi:uncharacterized protein (TIGR02611 family)
MSAPDEPEHLDRLDRLVDEAVEAERSTGRREDTVDEAERHLVLRVVRVVAGVVVLLIGLALLALPGPGLLAVALGLGLLASEVPFAARLLAIVRRRLPQDADGRLPRSTVVMMVVVAVAAVGASAAFTVLSLSS